MSVGTDYSQLRQYLLGALDEPARAAMEDRLFKDSALFELAESVETDLMDEYAAGTLAAADRTGWERYLAAHPESQRRLTFARTLRARRRANLHVMPRRRWYAAAALLAATLAIGFFSIRSPQEAVVHSAALSPGTLRSADQGQTVRMPSAATVLRIEWRGPQTGAVKVVIRSVNNREPVWTGAIQSGRSDLPAAVLPAGDYVATTLNAAGEETADYTFHVTR